MRVNKILCTLLLFGPLAVEANEATAPKGIVADSATGADRTTAKPVSGKALAGTATEKGAGANDRNTSVAAASHTATTQSRAAITPSPAATPRQMGRANADRLRSLLTRQARGRVVRHPLSSHVSSARAPTFMGEARQQRLGANGTQFGAPSARRLTRDVTSPAQVSSPMAARPVLRLSAPATQSTNGLPRAPGLALVGGPVVRSGVHNSSIDGTQLRPKFQMRPKT